MATAAAPPFPPRASSQPSPRPLLAAAGALGLVMALVATAPGGPLRAAWSLGASGPRQGTSEASGAEPSSSSPLAAFAVATPVIFPEPSPLSSPSPSPSPSPTVPPGPIVIPSVGLRDALASVRWRYGIPGVAVTIAFSDGRTWSGVSGVSDVTARRPLAPTTTFAFGSMTKTFVAALILKLAEEGRLSLDDPLVRWLPEYAGASWLPKDPFLADSITLRMLLAHSSGLYDFFSNLSLDSRLRADKRRVWRPPEVLRYAKKPWFDPGESYAYSNTNYVLLGLVAERAGGAPLANQLRERFLVPLGLATTYLQVAEATRGSPARGYDFSSLARAASPIPWGDGTKVMPFTAVTSAAGAAGALAGTSRDLARWGLALYGGAVLSPASLAAMLSFDGTAAPGAATDYGLGAGRRVIGGRLTYGHSGRLAGFRGVVRYVPALGVSLAVLTNQDRYDPDRIAEALLDVLDPPQPPAPSPSPAPLPLVPQPSSSPSAAPSIPAVLGP